MLSVQMDMKGREGAMRMAEVLLPFLRLVASLLLGVCAGIALATFVQWRPAQWKHLGPLARTLPPGFALRCHYPTPARAAQVLKHACSVSEDIN